ncbi:MAG: helix-turn-helix transcriptional regulator [Lachnospiraceae bacterium]|nr:helix-turn-helix transcriptional regulator [Lachnospiraceae bacterium]
MCRQSRLSFSVIPLFADNAETELGITRAEAARRLNMSAMGYGRYEKGERTPSYQTVSYIAHYLT